MKKINEKFIRDFCERHNVEIQREGTPDDKVWERILFLKHCPFNESHIDGDAKLLISNKGVVRFKCEHDSCKGKKLPDFIKKYEQDFYKDSGVNDSKGSEKKASREDVLSAVQKMSDIEEEEIEWLLPNYLVKGEVNILSAEGGSGKGFVTAALLSGLTRGVMPEFLHNNLPWSFEPQTVLYLTSEDSASKVLKPRLRMAGANLDNVQFIDKGNEILQNISFSDENGTLDILLDSLRPALVVFDPIQSFLPEKIRMEARNQMRRCINHLSVFGAKYGTTFLLFCHTNKRENADPRNKLADSSDLWDLSRSIMFTGLTSEGELRFFSQEKSNYYMLNETVLYRIKDPGVVEFAGKTDKKYWDFERERNQNRQQTHPSGALQFARDMIIESLKDNKGEMKTCELDDLCKAAGIKESTRDRAKTALKKEKIIDIRGEGFGKDKVFYTRLCSGVSSK